MKATVIDFAQWKAAHPPILIFWQHGLSCALAWQELWLKLYGATMTRHSR